MNILPVLNRSGQQRPKSLSNELKASCAVCLEFHINTDGFHCPQQCDVFTCWNCLVQSYGMASQPGAVQGSSNLHGELLCSNVNCKCAIKVADLAKCGAYEDIFQAHENLKVHILTAKRVAEALKQQEAQIRGEHARIEQIKDADEKAAVKLRLKIVDDVLTLRCPRCRTCFVDFDGCFALKCSNNSCRCGFCAWCLTDCGADAHQHVHTCPENLRLGADIFNTDEHAFQKHRRQKRIHQVKSLIMDAELNKSAREKLATMIRKDLEDLDIKLSDVMAVEIEGPPQALERLRPPPSRDFVPNMHLGDVIHRHGRALPHDLDRKMQARLVQDRAQRLLRAHQEHQELRQQMQREEELRPVGHWLRIEEQPQPQLQQQWQRREEAREQARDRARHRVPAYQEPSEPRDGELDIEALHWQDPPHGAQDPHQVFLPAPNLPGGWQVKAYYPHPQQLLPLHRVAADPHAYGGVNEPQQQHHQHELPALHHQPREAALEPELRRFEPVRQHQAPYPFPYHNNYVHWYAN